MNTTARLFLSKHYKSKDGGTYIYIRIIINRIKWDCSTGVKIYDIKKFDEKTQKLKGNLLDSITIEKAVEKAREIFIMFKTKDRVLTMEQFKKLYKKSDLSDSFYSFAEEEIRNIASIVSPGYHKQLRTIITKMQKFRKELSWSEFDLNLIESYERYMRGKLNNRINTVHKDFKRLKFLCNIALKKKIIRENPFDNYKLKTEKTHRSFLTIDELQLFKDTLTAAELKPHYLNVVKCFLFSCYTGIRFEDLKNLTFANVIKNSSGVKIHFKMEKTNTIIDIPLTSYAKELLSTGEKLDKVFICYTNQVTNKYLRDVVKNIGIDKDISFHCARHTFATLCLNNDVSLYTIKELLGHSKISTTQIYLNLIDKKKIEEMSNWEGKLK